MSVLLLAPRVYGATVQIPQSKLYPVSDLVRLVAKPLGKVLAVERRNGDRQLFVSQGVYEASDLFAAIRQATGLFARPVGQTWYLVDVDSALASNRDRVPLPLAVQRRSQALWQRWPGEPDLTAEGIPWTLAQFRARLERNEVDLSRDERAFIIHQLCRTQSSDGVEAAERPRFDEPAAQANRLLQGRSVRLGLSYTAFLVFWKRDTPTLPTTQFSTLYWMPLWDNGWPETRLLLPIEREVPPA